MSKEFSGHINRATYIAKCSCVFISGFFVINTAFSISNLTHGYTLSCDYLGKNKYIWSLIDLMMFRFFVNECSFIDAIDDLWSYTNRSS